MPWTALEVVMLGVECHGLWLHDRGKLKAEKEFQYIYVAGPCMGSALYLIHRYIDEMIWGPLSSGYHSQHYTKYITLLCV